MALPVSCANTSFCSVSAGPREAMYTGVPCGMLRGQRLLNGLGSALCLAPLSEPKSGVKLAQRFFFKNYNVGCITAEVVNAAGFVEPGLWSPQATDLFWSRPGASSHLFTLRYSWSLVPANATRMMRCPPFGSAMFKRLKP